MRISDLIPQIHVIENMCIQILQTYWEYNYFRTSSTKSFYQNYLKKHIWSFLFV